jgi:hypothetical protein
MMALVAQVASPYCRGDPPFCVNFAFSTAASSQYIFQWMSIVIVVAMKRPLSPREQVKKENDA